MGVGSRGLSVSVELPPNSAKLASGMTSGPESMPGKSSANAFAEFLSAVNGVKDPVKALVVSDPELISEVTPELTPWPDTGFDPPPKLNALELCRVDPE